MRTLLLLRHAKSSWDRPDLDDFDRPLAPRGEKAAPLIGRHMGIAGLLPDLVLCSPAERARRTYELVAAALDDTPPNQYPRLEMRRSLYLAGPNDLLAVVRGASEEVRTLMVIGHNPGLGMFAAMLCGDGEPRQLERMQQKFPTGGLAVITFEAKIWPEIAFETGRLRSFLRPKDLMKEG